ncbi:MAG: hypothetical protein K0R06_1320 [Clostridium sp.]|jgi:hypothetical protein|nr:hypothetical protein [Clostridium sp.]
MMYNYRKMNLNKSMIRSSKYKNLVKASLEWCKPNTVACIEWICER